MSDEIEYDGPSLEFLNYTLYALVRGPVASGIADKEISFFIAPERINDLKFWKDRGRDIALAFYRAYSGDKRGEELIKEFDKL